MPEDQHNITEKKMGGFLQRLLIVMKAHNISSLNELATMHLGYKSPQKLNRLKEEGNKPSAEIVADIISKWPELNGNWLLLGDGEMMLVGQKKDAPISNRLEKRASKDISLETISQDLQILKEGQEATLANVRAFGEYHVMREFPDRDAREQIMEQINKIVALNLGAIAKANNHAGGGRSDMENS